MAPFGVFGTLLWDAACKDDRAEGRKITDGLRRWIFECRAQHGDVAPIKNRRRSQRAHVGTQGQGPAIFVSHLCRKPLAA
jgi:hypothetical protein